MTTTAAPRWDLTDLFPDLHAREFAGAHEGLVADLARLTTLFDERDVRGGPPRQPGPADADTLEQVLEAANALLERSREVHAYLYARVSTDTRDDEAAGVQSQLQAELAGLPVLLTRLDAWVARLGADALVASSPVAADHAFTLRRGERAARHQMAEGEEALAATLRQTGSVAWQRLHRDLTSQLTAEVVLASGATERRPMSAVRGMATDPDPGIRRAAYEAELGAWEQVAVPLAAALNGAKGEHNVVNQRRGWSDALEPALFANNVDRRSLEAMTEAVVDSLPSFRRYLRAKAGMLGHAEGLPWWDLLAPTSATTGGIDWEDATQRVTAAFETYSPQLANVVARFTGNQWIDGEAREGKVGGAYCLPVRGEESRVLLNFDGSFDSVQTLAHELGHAYHNTNLGERTPLQRRTPMALAETASIFCETIVVEAGLREATESERLALLDTDLQGATQVVVDIHSRFLFEQELYRGRERRTLSVDELCELMLDAQRQAYGDGVASAYRHPYMWAVKGHYFTPFYNWPYTFGLLFGIGLFARYRRDPDRFLAGYDDLLASTGLADAADLAARFEIDVRSADFWRSSLDVIRARIDDFVALADETTTS